MKNVLILSFSLLACTALESQITWRGGVPGRETEWTEPLNWSAGQVPGWKDDVAIPDVDHGFFPEVGSVAPLIRSLTVHEGAVLVIQTEGVLSIDAAGKEDKGLFLEGLIFNYGALIFTEMELSPIEEQLENLNNYGTCSLVADMGHIPLLAAENQ
ncbi:MAG: hypothetical protein J5I94_08695 [Phaeodactylibacter sp.]|nr:hypothetical protein [Phaeodactylibacter sp.]